MTQPPTELSPSSIDDSLHGSVLDSMRSLKKRPLKVRLNSKAQPCEGMDNPMKQVQQAYWRHRSK